MTAADDQAIAMAVADEIVANCRWASIPHDTRRRSRMGPCPLPYYYARKNLVGIPIYRNPARARDWIVRALTLGYEVLGHSRRDTVAWASVFSIARQRERRKAVL